MLIEIHMLQNHSPANLNRDDLGTPKTAFFGGFPRARISSQCLKRAIRTSETFKELLNGHISTRTVFFPARIEKLLEDTTFDKATRKRIVEACTKIAKSERQSASDATPAPKPKTDQIIPIAPHEDELFVKTLQDMQQNHPELFEKFLNTPCPDGETDYTKRLAQCYQHNAVDIALFGRMVTSPAFGNVEASMQVAHAISSHELILETDYFTAVDDDPHGRLGAGHVNEAQFTSATFYKYFSLDWDAFLKNLNHNEDLARRALRAFIHAAAKAVPSGKRNSFANNNLPDAIIVELKTDKTPTNYANAFLVPARPRTDRDGTHDVVTESIRMLAEYVAEISTAYSIKAQRCVLITRQKDKSITFPDASPQATIHDLLEATIQALPTAKGAKS